MGYHADSVVGPNIFFVEVCWHATMQHSKKSMSIPLCSTSTGDLPCYANALVAGAASLRHALLLIKVQKCYVKAVA